MNVLKGITESDPADQSGATVFVGTRIPVQSLFDYLEGGDTVPEFLRQFPTVSPQQVLAVLEAARISASADAHPA